MYIVDRNVYLYDLYGLFQFRIPPEPKDYKTTRKTLSCLEKYGLIRSSSQKGHNRTTWYLSEDGNMQAQRFLAEWLEIRKHIELVFKEAKQCANRDNGLPIQRNEEEINKQKPPINSRLVNRLLF